MSTALDVLRRARTDLGYREGANNANKFSASWHKPGQAWCADAVTRWLADAKALDVPQSSYTPALADSYRKAGRFGRTPRVGAVVFFKWPGMGRIAHVGIVESIRPDGRLVVLEGNTNAAGSRTGGGVFRKVRARSLVAGYGYPAYTATAKTAAKKGDRVLMIGAKGQDVLNVQHALVKAGLRVAQDGQYGPGTKGAVAAFQQSHKIAASGNVGAETWAALRKVAHG